LTQVLVSPGTTLSAALKRSFVAGLILITPLVVTSGIGSNEVEASLPELDDSER